MKKSLSLICVIGLLFSLCVCSGCAYDSFGHETYTKVEEYSKVFELPEIRYPDARDDLFPKDVTNLSVQDFYFEWELGIVGSADVEMYLAVSYNEQEFNEEISRLKSLADGKVKFDTENFEYPAYVTVLGHDQTSVYALVEQDKLTIHYVMLQLLNERRIDIGDELLPDGYCEFGEVLGNDYNTYEE